MSAKDETSGGESAGLPFARPVVRKIVEDLFRAQAQWKTQVLVDRVVQLHRDRGGSMAANPKTVIGRILVDLKADGQISNLAHGWWRWTGSAAQDGSVVEDLGPNASAPEDEAMDELDESLRPEKEIGSGTECVYLYFNPNDRRLAELEGRDVWECKIGRTSSSDAISRILGQGVRTALSRLPTVGIVLRTEDSAALEQALHSSLRLLEAEVPDSPGIEWFLTSPARVEAWYSRFQDALAVLRLASNNPV
jgi:hypothetical protein